MNSTPRSPVLAALTNPFSLLALGLALVFGLCAAWWLFPVGLLVWGALVVSTLRDPALQLDQIIRGRTPLPQRFQQRFTRIQRAQISLFHNLAATRPQVRKSFQPLQEAVNQIAEQAYYLCVRMTTLQNYYLVTKNNRDFEGELFAHKVHLENTTDELARRDYLETQKTLEEQANNFRQIATLLERVEAQLTSISSMLDSVLVDAMRLQALRPEDIDKEMPSLLQPIKMQAEQLALFEKEAARSHII